jgi:pimeloyl-ACP methyl ester carboxylesterase
MTDLQFLDRGAGERLACRRLAGSGPGLFWVGGFRSTMEGTKAEYLAGWAASRRRAMLRFDYYAHGRSSGDFVKGTISRWRDDALTAFDRLTEGPQIVVGSSMGGWIADLLTRVRTDRVAALVLLAPAPDFTEDLMWSLMPETARKAVLDTGQWLYEGESESYPITHALIESGRENLVLDKPQKVSFPVRILHGMADTEVPWHHTLKLVDILEGDVRLTLLKNSGHHLSTPEDLKLIAETVDGLYEGLRQ